MNNFWHNKKVLVTGGGGFVGSHLVERLVDDGASVTVLGGLSERSLRNLKDVNDNITFQKGDAGNIYDAVKACHGQDAVFNLAMRVGGIEYNKTHPATTLRDNLTIGQAMIEAAYREHVERFLVVSSACVYPSECSIPTPEAEGFKGEPEQANGGYGWAKRISEKLGMYYAEEYGMNISIVRPYNIYGPRDHFDPPFNVVPSLIKRIMDGENPLVVWGSGKQTRAFLYVDDVIDGMLLALEKYTKPDPINLGTDEEITIGQLANLIVELSGRKTMITFDTSKPDGALRRNSNNSKAEKLLGFKAKTQLKEGLQKTIEWYNNRA